MKIFNYKKIFKSQKLRMRILRFLSFLPDKFTVKYQYRIKCGRKLNLENPKRYSEKIQWYKLYYRVPLLNICADKYAVREYVESKGLGHILNSLYAVYDNADDIDFSSLPNSYAMKCNNGGARNYFVKDSSQEDTQKLRKLANGWISKKPVSIAAEWCYEDIPNKVIFERLLPRDERNDLPDYKFFCFNGEPFCLYTMIDYTDNHANGKLGFYDMEFNQLPYRRLDFAPITEKLPKPKNFDKMVEYARILSKDFPHVRVDFYNIDGEIVFGELTFQNGSGYINFEPDEFDFIMGEKFVLPEKSVKNNL